MNLFTEEDMLSDFYRWRNEKGTPKRLKFFVFSSFKPATDLNMYYQKRKRYDDDNIERDVDYLYLKKRLIDKFAAKPGSEDHFDIYQNQKEKELWDDVFRSLEKDTRLHYYDCFIFVFLTYISPASSEKGDLKIHFYDSQVPIDKIWDRVSILEAMRGKPKVFLVQADDVRLMQEPPTMTKTGGFDTVERKIPTDADRLTIMSTIPGRYFVTNDEPSFLIRAFTEVLDEYALEQMDLLSLTVLINQKVLDLIGRSEVEKTKRQATLLPIPCTTSTLRKLLVI